MFSIDVILKEAKKNYMVIMFIIVLGLVYLKVSNVEKVKTNAGNNLGDMMKLENIINNDSAIPAYGDMETIKTIQGEMEPVKPIEKIKPVDPVIVSPVSKKNLGETETIAEIGLFSEVSNDSDVTIIEPIPEYESKEVSANLLRNKILVRDEVKRQLPKTDYYYGTKTWEGENKDNKLPSVDFILETLEAEIGPEKLYENPAYAVKLVFAYLEGRE